MNVNTAFLTMAIEKGLTMAIANPSQEMLVNAAFASDLLRKKEGSDLRYIQRMQLYEAARVAAGFTAKETVKTVGVIPAKEDVSFPGDNIIDIITK